MNNQAPVDPDRELSCVVWREPEENPFNMRVLDCRPFCTTRVSCTANPAVADRFAESRQSNGEEYRGQQPPNLLTVVKTNLVFPHDGKTPKDGPMFLASVMEDKWDIFLHEGYLYFTRSWTGKLFFRAKINFGNAESTVTAIEADSELVDGDPEMAIQQIDFLIKSHLLGFECPHPVPSGMRDEDHQKIAIWSFQSFGRRGFFATFEDTTVVRVQH